MNKHENQSMTEAHHRTVTSVEILVKLRQVNMASMRRATEAPICIFVLEGRDLDLDGQW
jgi:hypothetical protein